MKIPGAYDEDKMGKFIVEKIAKSRSNAQVLQLIKDTGPSSCSSKSAHQNSSSQSREKKC